MIETLSPKKELEDLQATCARFKSSFRRHACRDLWNAKKCKARAGGISRAQAERRRTSPKLRLMHRRHRVRARNRCRWRSGSSSGISSKRARRRNLLQAPMRCARLSSAAWICRSWSLRRAVGGDEIADLAPDLPGRVIHDVFQALPVEEREQLRARCRTRGCGRRPHGFRRGQRARGHRDRDRHAGICGASMRSLTIPTRSSRRRDERLKGVLPLSKTDRLRIEHNVGRSW